jgi:predicted NACHT family NTPase
VQASENCVVSNQLYGESHTVTTNFFLTASDSNTKLIFEKLNGYAEAARYKPLAQLGTQIEELRTAYLNVLEEVDEIRVGLALYIPSEGQETAASKITFTLIDKVREFLSSKEKVLLLLGEAGSGKSTFNRHLTRMLWDEYQQSSTAPIPVFIALAEHTPTCADLIESYLLEHEFSPEAITELRKAKRLVFILDGFDEIKDRTQAFYTQNKLDHWKNAQV